jgi:uncharacterized protein (TIGR00730 family)
MMKAKAITVFGSSKPQPGSTAYRQARELGRLLGRAGVTVINGGYTGTMEAVSRGVTEVGGTAIGITCAVFDGERPAGNPYLSQSVHAPDLLARLRHLTEMGDGYIVLEGGVGTLLELLLVWNLLTVHAVDRPCILVGAGWRLVLASLEQETEVAARHTALLQVTDSVEDAASLIAEYLANI